jgi:hypothetical protein
VVALPREGLVVFASDCALRESDGIRPARAAARRLIVNPARPDKIHASVGEWQQVGAPSLPADGLLILLPQAPRTRTPGTFFHLRHLTPRQGRMR